jgi:predicted nucleotidyltransferase
LTKFLNLADGSSVEYVPSDNKARYLHAKMRIVVMISNFIADHVPRLWQRSPLSRMALRTMVTWLDYEESKVSL